jgi:hypothetical protein
LQCATPLIANVSSEIFAVGSIAVSALQSDLARHSNIHHSKGFGGDRLTKSD